MFQIVERVSVNATYDNILLCFQEFQSNKIPNPPQLVQGHTSK